jgi:superfamily II DNA or RNA helicase
MAIHIEMQEKPVGIKTLYPYQVDSVERIFGELMRIPQGYNLLFQLPTGGGKTIIFSEITKRYIEATKKKVLILTHRIELSQQTSRALSSVGVKSKVISSDVKELYDQSDYNCFVAMVETLNNRLSDDGGYIGGIGLVIVDEAHYNAFRKLFGYFKDVNILGVTATPLSSNKNLPLNADYNNMIIGDSIADLIEKKFLCDGETFTYDVNLRSLKIGIDGDYSIGSLDRLYGNFTMLEKILNAYEEKAAGSKTLIFNSSIKTSKKVYEEFMREGYKNVRHLDSTFSKVERKETLDWFRATPDGILTSVGILTMGFDEPSVGTIILNRATRSLTLYHQMIGRGSRIWPGKKNFKIIDLGNNAFRLGAWQEFIDWKTVFHFPLPFIEKHIKEEDYSQEQEYIAPEEVLKRLPNSIDSFFCIKETYRKVVAAGQKPNAAVNLSIDNHHQIIIDHTSDYYEALELADLLKGEIEYRIRQYSSCVNGSDNYSSWLAKNYAQKLRSQLRVSLLQ